MFNITTQAPALRLKTAHFAHSPRTSWELLNPHVRFFLLKKKLFLLKQVPKNVKELIYYTNPGVSDFTEFSQHPRATLLSLNGFYRGWVERLAAKTNFYYNHLLFRQYSYRFKKQFKPLNKVNRRHLKQLLFPDLEPRELTAFFKETKNLPKAYLVTFLIARTPTNTLQLNWHLTKEAALVFQILTPLFPPQLYTPTPGYYGHALHQMPLSVTLLTYLNYMCGLRWRTGTYKTWDYTGLNISTETVELPDREVYLDRHSPVETLDEDVGDYYKQPHHLSVAWGSANDDTDFYTERETSKPVNTLVYKGQLDPLCLYDYRTLTQLRFRDGLWDLTRVHKVPDINILNFRTFNWQVIT